MHDASGEVKTTSPETRTIAGVTLLTVRQNFYRAGHAHAGVFVPLSLVCQMLADSATLPPALPWLVRLGVPAAAISLPLGFFVSVARPNETVPNHAVWLIYLGALLLAVSVLTLGVGLLRTA